VLLATTALAAPASAAAIGWTEPVIVFQTNGFVADQRLIVDSSQTVHLFFASSQQRSPDTGSTGSLMYARLERGRWSKPQGVLVTPGGGQVLQPAVAIDSRGFVHAIWKGGAFGRLYYSRAHVLNAGNATGWTPPQEVSAGGLAPGSFGRPADIAVADHDVVHVVFSTREGVLRERRSYDGGDSWSSLTTIADNVASGEAADNPRILVNGLRLMVTWTQVKLPTAWPNLGLYSSTSLDGGSSWSRQARIAGPDYSLASTVAYGVRLLFRSWHAVAAKGETRYQWSIDGGQTWTPSELIDPGLRSGLSGDVGMAFDSAGILHVVLAAGGRGPNPESVVYYLATDGKKWTAPVYISTGANGHQSVEAPGLAISRGNQLHVVYIDSSQRIWYTSKPLDAPGLPSQPVPAPVRAIDREPTPAPTSTPYLAPEPTIATGQALASPAGPPTVDLVSSPRLPLVAGAGASVILLAALGLARTLIGTRD
jgi:hypothetical protein